MQIRTFVKDGVCRVEVIDASDGAVTHICEVNEGQQCVVTATTAHSPADIEFGDVEAIPTDESEAPAGEGSGDVEAEAPAEGEAEGAEEPEGGEVQPDGEGEQAA